MFELTRDVLICSLKLGDELPNQLEHISLKSRFRQCFSESVNFLIGTTNINYTNLYDVNMEEDKVKLHTNILYTTMENLIFAQECVSKIVTIIFR